MLSCIFFLIFIHCWLLVYIYSGGSNWICLYWNIALISHQNQKPCESFINFTFLDILVKTHKSIAVCITTLFSPKRLSSSDPADKLSVGHKSWLPATELYHIGAIVEMITHNFDFNKYGKYFLFLFILITCFISVLGLFLFGFCTCILDK
jgi:hypothetical protein